MTSRGSRRQKTKQALTVLGGGAVLAGVVGLATLGYHVNWTGFNVQASQPAKTLWDWMQLLIVPMVLAFGGALYNHARDRTDRKIASDKQREDILQAYLGNISHLLLEKDLLDSLRPINGRSAIENVAYVQTATVLRQLDAERKEVVFSFLRRSGLISGGFRLEDVDLQGVDLSRNSLPRISLNGANLSRANLRKAILFHAYLMEADLTQADLQEADLGEALLGPLAWKAKLSEAEKRGANLSKANLREANLSKADLERANLHGADLRWADLRGADLRKANLRGAKLRGALLDGANLSEATVTVEQLRMVKSCKNVIIRETVK